MAFQRLQVKMLIVFPEIDIVNNHFLANFRILFVFCVCYSVSILGAK
jgi:hypothetical protein